jgi:hypothetical protein
MRNLSQFFCFCELCDDNLTNTNDEGQYIIGVEKTTSFVMIKNNEDYKFYTVSIDEKTYKETREYLNNVPHNLNINN